MSDNSTLKVMPLGGLGEIGMNMMLFEYSEEIIIVDCGHMFPDEEMLGVDLVIPDITYLIENKDRIRALIVTHGHEDHTGGIPYLLRQIPVPIYGTPLTLALIKAKLREHKLGFTVLLHNVAYRTPFRLDSFEIEFIHVTHSIANSAGLAIKTPVGTCIFSSDFKIDSNPIDGVPFDFFTFSKYGERGVLALFTDSTNIERAGHSPSERDITPSLHRLFEQAPRAIIISTFSSCIHRIQQIIDITHRLGKRLFINGLNLERNVSIARELGFLKVPDGLIESIKKMSDVRPHKRVILTTGSQGEPLSALSRMALDDHKHLKIKPNDTVIISARVIPGNEKTILKMVNHLYKRGATVHYEWTSNVHSSGHAYAGEIENLVNLTKPKYLIPVHGETRHLVASRDMGVRMGLAKENILLLENGDVLEFCQEGSAEITGKITAGRVLVDGKGIGDVGEIVLRDRKHLSEDGMLIVILAIDRNNGEVISGPDIVSRGFVYVDESAELIDKCKKIVIETLESCKTESKEDWGVVKEEVRKALRRFLRKQTDRRPMILPVIMEV